MSSTADPSRYRSRVALATVTLLVSIASHALRETARDALFLGGLPAERLPWAYLAIAVGAVAVGMINRLLLERFSHRRLLVATLGAALLVDVLFWRITADPSPSALFGLYAWTGVLGTAITLQLWLHLADIFDVAESKRAFPLVAAGGLAGAVLGSVFAGTLLFAIDTRSLLLASAALLLVAAFVASALPPRAGARPSEEGEEGERRSAPLSETLRSSYLLRITLLAVCVSILATGVDFVFKHTVAATIPTAQLGSFFAWFNAGANTFALLFELVIASWALRHFGVTKTLAILPGSLLIAIESFVVFPGLVAALAQKFIDGTLRLSLHQASTEVLFQPLSSQARNAAKTAAESLGKRGGQALASIAILGAAGMSLDSRWIALGLLPAALLALVAIRGLRVEYVERFRERLSGFAEDARASLPVLDLHSLEALVSNLSSPDDAEVLGAIELLQRYGRTALISPLLLHHPSRRVVLRALQILQAEGHPHLGGILNRLLEHSEAEVRAAALNALVASGSPTVPIERLFHSDPSATVRSTAVVALAARHERREEALEFLRGLLEGSTPEERIAVVRALPRLPHSVASEIARDVTEDGDSSEAKALAQALSHEPSLDADWIPTLIALLARREARPAARAALLRRGDGALHALERALRDPETDPAVRRHLPRTIHRFGSAKAAEILVGNLERADPVVGYKILRGLGRLRADDPELELPEAELEQEAGRSLDRAIEMLAFRVAYYLWADRHGVPVGDGALLGRALMDEEARSLERVFRALHILDPKAEFGAIFEALRTPGESAHAEGLERIQHLVGDGLREGLLAMIGPKRAAVKLHDATRSHGSSVARDLADALASDGGDAAESVPTALEGAIEAVLARLLADADPILSELARYHCSAEESGGEPVSPARRSARA